MRSVPDVNIPKTVKEVVQRIDPTATVILYGSRARGDARADSDWDFLVLGESETNTFYRREIGRALFELELATGEVISAVVRSKKTWYTDFVSMFPINENIMKEGLLL